MGSDIDINGLAIEIQKALEEYSEEIKEGIVKVADEVAKEGVENLKVTSPKKTGNYAKNWKVKKRDGYNFVNCTIYNPKWFMLTHLLEFGHATRNGGRTRAFPHIQPVEEEIKNKFEQKVKEVIRNGG